LCDSLGDEETRVIPITSTISPAGAPNRRTPVRFLVLLIGLALGTGLNAQGPPPVNGTVAIEGTTNAVYRAANAVIIATFDAVKFVGGLFGGKGSGIDPFDGLREGSTVIVQYSSATDEPSDVGATLVADEGPTAEGIVTRIDRGRQDITVRFEKGRTETFQLAARQAAQAMAKRDQSATPPAVVTIYYSNPSGQKIAHFFTQVS
jgi:hypothetical protein